MAGTTSHDKDEQPKRPQYSRTPIQLLNNFFFAVVLLAIAIGAIVFAFSR